MERLTSSSEYSSLTMEVTGRTSRENDISYKDFERTNAIINCDPCENEGDEQPAEGFCENCQEYLCASCFKIHRRPAVWRHHVLLDKENMPSSKTTKEQLNYECTEPCSEHSTKVLEYFCQTHSQLGCPVCITTKHRMCNDVDYIPDIAGHFRESTEVKETFKTLQSLKEDINTYSATISVDKMKVKTYEKNAKEHILQLRDEFESICNRLIENVEHVSSSDESNIQGYLEACEDILNKIKIRQSVLEKKQADMKVSQLFTEAKLSKLSAKEFRREFETIKESTKCRHYEIKFDIEALREMMKLTFRDQINENAKDSSECDYPQKKTGIRDDYRDIPKTDFKEENVDKNSGDAWGNSRYVLEEKTDCVQKNEEKNNRDEQKHWKTPLESKTDCVQKTKEKNNRDEQKHWKTPVYKDITLESKTDCVQKTEEKNNRDERKHWKTPVYKDIKAERTPQKQEDRAYGKERVAYCEDSKYELESKTDCVQKNEEKNNRDERKHWKTPIYKDIKVTRKAYDKAENISKGSRDTYEKETTDYKESVDSPEHSEPEVNWKAYDKKENVKKISEDVCELPRSPVTWKAYKAENISKISKISGDTWGHSKFKGSWDTYEKETTNYKKSVDSSEHSESEFPLKNVGQIIKLSGDAWGHSRSKGSWDTYEKETTDYKTSIDSSEHSKSEGPQKEQYQTRRQKKNKNNMKGQKGRRYEESQMIATQMTP